MLANTLYQLERAKSLRVAYFGGSITEGGGEQGWRRLTTKWIEERWPDAEVTEINAAIGGTGTDLGVYRCDRDVIAHKPDLTFVEFAVNDSGFAPEHLSRTAEGIVRKLLSSNPAMDIVFVFTITKYIADKMLEGVPYTSRDIHSAIAAHYGLPRIDVGTVLSDAANKAEKGWLEYTPDNVHPNAAGYELWAAAMEPAIASALGETPISSVPASLENLDWWNERYQDDLALIENGEFDLVFIDGDKREYPQYYEMVMDGLVHSGSYLLADNVLWYGKVAEPVARNDRHTQAILEFNRMVCEDPRVESVILPLRDGLNLIRVK